MSINDAPTRREELRADRVADAEQRRADRAAELAEQREDRRLAFEQQQETKAAQKADRDAQRDKRKAARARLGKAIVSGARTHALDLLFVPVILVPAILAWSAMAAYGKQVFGGVGVLLPLFSEAAMWAFAFAVTLGTRRGEPTGWLKAGVWVFAAVAAGLNFLHGYSDGHHWDIGVVMAVVSIGGVVVHQLITARSSGGHQAHGESSLTVQPSTPEASNAAPVAPVQPPAVQPEPVQAAHVQTGPANAPVQPSGAESGPSPSTPVQPEHVADGAADEVEGQRRAVSLASPAKDRARTAARRHAAHHGDLPTVSQLMDLADVSRGTAGTALQELREQPAQLHIINDNTQTRNHL
ncbi:DUF2637 domain-containing protein [Amycolatopsis sp. NPDC059657]|uniref:DUF2637 domain-containing protein n=1 Tax=Amycolatopsis sp. NPDC059657 TaxID=3346899 RepID=UPI00366F689A